MEEPLIITKAYDLILYLVPQIAKFPKQYRYSLGEKLEMMSLDFLMTLIEARYSKEKIIVLKKANLSLEKLRYCIRLCKDLKLMSHHPYEIMTKRVHEIGLQLGGWIKQSRV
ncbi:MAG: diversity-generating retroelement protein Avd [Deltaproteobacteria bacterium]|nr:MAG: diversity-generating retroelement protein Avd [Deltaproteobacteria bacterium]